METRCSPPVPGGRGFIYSVSTHTCSKQTAPALTCALPAALVLLGGAHQFAVEVLLPVLGKPHVPPVVLQSPRSEVGIEP